MIKDKRLLIVMVMLMTTFIGFGIIIPVLPELIKEASPGSVEFHTGMMLSLYSAGILYDFAVLGRLSDRIGRRPVILIGVLGFAASFLVFGIADGSLPIMYASRVLGGLFSGAVTSVIVAYVADITPPDQRTKGMGLVGMSIGLGFTIGPGFGGLLSLVSRNTPFFAAAALALVTFLIAVTKLPESFTPEMRSGARAEAVPMERLHRFVKIFVRAGFVRIAVARRTWRRRSVVRHEALRRHAASGRH